MSSTTKMEQRSQPTPTLAGRYQVVRTLATGDVGATFLGYDLRLHRWRAIDVPRDRASKRILARDAELLTKLEHPAVERVMDTGEDGPVQFVVREYLVGCASDHVPLSPALTVAIAIRVTEGLSHAHSREIFHGHVRPSVIRFAEDGQAVLTGFGRAPPVDSSTSGRASEPWAHLAPELRQRWRPDGPSEVYAVGALIYSLVTGRTEPDLFYAESYEGVLAPIPRTLRALVTAACNYDAAARPDLEGLRGNLLNRAQSLPPSTELPWSATPLPSAPPETVVADIPLSELIAALNYKTPVVSSRPKDHSDATPDPNDATTARPYVMPRLERKDPGFRDPFAVVDPADLPAYVDRTAKPVDRRRRRERVSDTGTSEEDPTPPPPGSTRRPADAMQQAFRTGALVMLGLAAIGAVVWWFATSDRRAGEAFVSAVSAERAAVEGIASVSADRAEIEAAWFRFEDTRTPENARAYVGLASDAANSATASTESRLAVDRMKEALEAWRP